MQFGPTSIRLSGVLARGLQRPKLRSDLKVSKQTFAGEVSYVIKIPETDSFNRIGEFDWEVLALCDGTRTPAEIATELNEDNTDVSLSAEEVTEFLAGIDENTWERSPAEKNLCILEKIRDERRERVNHASLLYIYFSAFDPDKVLTRLNRYTGWLFTKQFFFVSLEQYATSPGQQMVRAGGARTASAGRWEGAGSGGAVASVPDRDVAHQRAHDLVVEDLSDQADLLVHQDVETVAHRDAGGLLPAVLQRVEPK